MGVNGVGYRIPAEGQLVGLGQTVERLLRGASLLGQLAHARQVRLRLRKPRRLYVHGREAGLDRIRIADCMFFVLCAGANERVSQRVSQRASKPASK